MKKATKFVLAFNGLGGGSMRHIVHGAKDMPPVFEDSVSGNGVPKAARDAAKQLYKKGAFDFPDRGGSIFLVNGTWALYPVEVPDKSKTRYAVAR